MRTSWSCGISPPEIRHLRSATGGYIYIYIYEIKEPYISMYGFWSLRGFLFLWDICPCLNRRVFFLGVCRLNKWSITILSREQWYLKELPFMCQSSLDHNKGAVSLKSYRMRIWTRSTLPCGVVNSCAKGVFPVSYSLSCLMTTIYGHGTVIWERSVDKCAFAEPLAMNVITMCQTVILSQGLHTCIPLKGNIGYMGMRHFPKVENSYVDVHSIKTVALQMMHEINCQHELKAWQWPTRYSSY